jgi:RNA polymerase sigma-70 factor (ECF subfamily)
VNACYREAGRSKRRRSIEVHVRVLEASEPDASLDFADRDQVERGFRRLDTDQRTVLVLHYFLGLSLDEAADVLSIPRGTVRSRLHRAIVAMRSALEADARSPLLTEGRPS